MSLSEKSIEKLKYLRKEGPGLYGTFVSLITTLLGDAGAEPEPKMGWIAMIGSKDVEVMYNVGVDPGEPTSAQLTTGSEGGQ